MSKKVRLSNLELLRIIAMIGVLTVHTDFGVLGFPTRSELITNSSYCITRIIIEMLAVVSVNVFVLISGWFSITFRWRGIFNLLFQCGFFFFGIYLFLLLFGFESQRNLGKGLYACLMLSDNAWFVKCYLAMYIFAPIMNTFAERASQQIFRNILICFFVFQSIYGWFSNGAAFIMQGYSAFSFMGLYLLARYLRIYSPKIIFFKPIKDFSIYVMTSLISALLFVILLYLDKPALYLIMISYTSPLVIIASIFLLLSFYKIPFTNNFINQIATSCFAVYLFHFMIFPLFMRNLIRDFGNKGQYIYIVFLLIGFFIVSILIDRLRLTMWRKFILKRFND